MDPSHWFPYLSEEQKWNDQTTRKRVFPKEKCFWFSAYDFQRKIISMFVIVNLKHSNVFQEKIIILRNKIIKIGSNLNVYYYKFCQVMAIFCHCHRGCLVLSWNSKTSTVSWRLIHRHEDGANNDQEVEIGVGSL